MRGVYVEVDLDDLSTEDLIDELETRGHTVKHMGTVERAMDAMFMAFKLGQDGRALTLARKLVCDVTGKVL